MDLRVHLTENIMHHPFYSWKPLTSLLRNVSWVCVLLLTISCVTSDDQSLMPIRDTKYGKVRGYVHLLKDGRQVERYLGVPYAAPPVGDRRFQFPEPPTPWSNVRSTDQLSPACMQSLLDVSYIGDHNPDFDGKMSEDCLYLNVYVPRRQDSNPSLMAVLIHVHGGSNEVGMGAMFHGDVLASLGEVVVVTLNYRLFVFGFLSAPHRGIPGNYGLYDQLFAFKWVKDNIANFGGDPSKVTLQGHSAGSTDVGLHVLSPLSKDLFRYVVLQSGSPTALWAMIPPSDPNDKTKGPTNHLIRLGCYLDTAEETLSCLQSLNAVDLANRTYEHGNGRYVFSPVVDRTFVPNRSELYLRQMLITGQVRLNSKAIMLGVVKDEGSQTEVIMKNYLSKLYPGEVLVMKNKHLEVPKVFEDRMFDYISDSGLERTQEYSHLKHLRSLSRYVYKPWKDPDNVTANLISLSDFAGDVTFTAPTIKFADILVSLNYSNLYVYSFEHLSKTSGYPLWMGVPHGDDQFYLFGAPIEGHHYHNYTSLDEDVSRALIDMWANFIKNGQPSHDQSFKPRKYTRGRSYISINSNDTDVIFSNHKHMRARYIAYWNFLVPQLAKPFRVSKTSDPPVSLWVLVALLCVTLPVCLIIIACLVCRIRRSESVNINHVNGEETAQMFDKTSQSVL